VIPKHLKIKMSIIINRWRVYKTRFMARDIGLTCSIRIDFSYRIHLYFRGFHGHLVIHENNIFVNSRKILLCESTKISAVQLQPFLHNDPFLLKCRLIAYHVMMALLKYVLFLYLSSLKQQNDQNFSFFSM